MNLDAIIGAIDGIAPPRLAWPDDPIGLHVGRVGGDVERILVCLDATPSVVAEAAEAGAELIFAHHPLIYRPLKQLTDATCAEKTVRELIRSDIALYVAHTNLDCAREGVCRVLAEKLGLIDIHPLKTSSVAEHKVVVFVPRDALEEVSDAMGGAGAGHIGEYSGCTFRTPGTGTFTASDDAHPAVGRPGQSSEVDEFRLEATVVADRLGDVLAAVRRSHPYETPAIDVYDLRSSRAEPGLGRCGLLPEALRLDVFARHVQDALDAETVRFAGDASTRCKSVAVCGGSGSACLADAVRAGCDACVLGELGYHEAIDAVDAGLCIVEAGHAETEQIIVPRMCELLGERLSGVDVVESKLRPGPWVGL